MISEKSPGSFAAARIQMSMPACAAVFLQAAGLAPVSPAVAAISIKANIPTGSVRPGAVQMPADGPNAGTGGYVTAGAV